MNTNSITKLFTLVSFFVVTVFGQPGFSAELTLPSGETTESKIAQAVKICNGDVKSLGYKSIDHCKQCATANVTGVTIKGCPSGSSDSGGDSDCNTAYKEYEESMEDSESACESVAGGSSKTTDKKKACSDKIKECASVAATTSSQAEQPDGGISSTINIFRQVIGGESSLGSSNSNSCLVDIDSKEARDAEKEFRDRRKTNTEDKKKIEDEAIKDKEENDKQITELTKKIQELQRDNKETLAKADKEMREQLNQSQKDLVDSSARLRNLTQQMSKKSDSLRALTFSYTDRMMDTSAQKQNLRCKAALDQAKTCMIKSAKNISDPTCKDFPFTIKSKGPKATAELRTQLKVVNDACYEKEEREKKKLQFDQQEQLKRINDEMTELQAQAKEEGQRQQIQSENSSKIQQESERQKNEANANLADQIATLQGEMAQLAQSLQAKSLKSQERLQQLAQELQTIELEEKTGKRSKTKLAQRAVNNTNRKLKNVIELCECNEDLSPKEGASEVQIKKCNTAKGTIPSTAAPDKKKKKSGSSGTTW